MKAPEFVIVGGGLAAATAAQTLREEGFEGRIRLIGAEPHPPYLRPPLSKEYMKGEAERESVFVQPEAWYGDHDVELVLGTGVHQLDTASGSLELDDGSRLGYDAALLATGAAPRRLGLQNADAEGIHYLRTLDDSEALRGALAGGGRQVVLVGSGWIGLELAAAARGYGNEVTVVSPDSVPLASALGDELGGVFARLHTDNGVTLELPAQVRGFTAGNGRVTGVVTDTGTVPADVVIVGIGAIPNVELAGRAGLDIDNGVLTDQRMRTSAEHVFAAGDVANSFHPVLARHLRNEHWANALGGGKAAAKSMLGRSVSYDDIPYFYTDQYDLGMEYSGYPTLASTAEVVYRGDVDAREFIAFWHLDGRIVAGMNVNVWDVNDEVQALIRSGRRVDIERIPDGDVPLAEL